MVDHIHVPSDTRVFVFGSNKAGIHGAGAALYARKKLDAQIGLGEGPTDRTYALPTCSFPGVPLTLQQVAGHVAIFLKFAKDNPGTRFFISEIGCGFAGFTADEISPLFRDAPKNCDLPPRWRNR